MQNTTITVKYILYAKNKSQHTKTDNFPRDNMQSINLGSRQ